MVVKMDRNDIAKLHREDAKLFRQLAHNAEKRAKLIEGDAPITALDGGGNGNGPPPT